MVYMKRPSTVAAAVGSILLAASGSAFAADLTGRVVDAASGRPLANASVVLEGTDRTAVTDGAGNFRFADAPAGAQRVTADSIGYSPASTDISVPSGAAPEVAVSLRLQPQLGDVSVTGFRLAQLTSLQSKRSANTIKDTLSADDAGRLPDRNAAEALQRVPGVSITTDQGEGRYVSIRGIDSALSNITIDGATIGAPEDDRRIALDTIPSEVLARLEVIKAVTPDMDGNAVGGSVNLVTPSAFDAAEARSFTASADIGYYDLNEDNPYRGSFAYTQQFGAERQFGLVVSGSYSSRTYLSENIQGGAEWTEEGDFLVPDEFVLRDYELERIRSGIVVNLEWQPREGTKLYWRNLWNQFQDTEERQAAEIDYRNGDLLDQTPTSGTFTEAEAARLVKYRREKQSILNSTLGGEFAFDRWTVSAALTYGEAEQDTPFDNEWEFATADVFPATYDTSDFFWNVDGGAPFSDEAGYEFAEVGRFDQIVNEELTVANLDVQRDLDFGSYPGYVKVGAKFTGRDKTSDQSGEVFDGYGNDLLLSEVSIPGRPSFLTSVRPFYPFGPRVNYGAVEQVFAADRALFELDGGATLEENLAADYDITEDVTAGYVMAGVTLGSVQLLGGVRVERTDATFSAFDLVFEDGDLDPNPVLRRGENDYTDVLPGLQMRMEAAEDLIVRAAWTNTIGRPQFEALVPRRVFEIDPDGAVFEGSVEEGNPELKPLESMNFDVSVEWYLQPAGLLSAGAFYKDIENAIFDSTTVLEDTTFEGRPFSELTITRKENAPTAELLGFELNYQQQFVGLPAPFDGFGVVLNYTYTDGEAEVFGRDDVLPFFVQPEHTGNVQLYYAKGGFEARLAYAYRSEYLDEVAGSPEEDIYVDERATLDYKMSYAFGERWKAFVEVLNITDEPLRILRGNRLLAENEIYSWNAFAGVSVRF